MAGVVDLRCVVIVFRRPIPAPWVTMFSCGLPRRTLAQARQNLCPVESYYFFLIALSGMNVHACGSAFEQLRKNLYMDLRVSSYGPPFHYLINGYFFLGALLNRLRIANIEIGLPWPLVRIATTRPLH